MCLTLFCSVTFNFVRLVRSVVLFKYKDNASQAVAYSQATTGSGVSIGICRREDKTRKRKQSNENGDCEEWNTVCVILAPCLYDAECEGKSEPKTACIEAEDARLQPSLDTSLEFVGKS